MPDPGPALDRSIRTRGVSADYIAGLIGRPALDDLLSRVEVSGGPAIRRDIIDYVTAWKVMNANVGATGDEAHRLSNAAVPNGNFELLVASMVQGESLADGLARMVAGARILRPDLAFHTSVRHGRAQLTVAFAAGETLAQAIYLEALMIVIHCAVRWGLEQSVDPVRVRGPALIDPASGSWLNLLAMPVQRHGAGVTIVYGPEVSAAPFRQHAFSRWHDATFNEYLRLVSRLEDPAPAPEASFVRRVREALMAGARGQAEVAGALAMSVPSLRRRLTEEGVTFRSLQAALRRDAAQVLLLGDKSVEEIATELGLSDSRCFRRACKLWFGGSPSQVRRSLRLNGLDPPSVG